MIPLIASACINLLSKPSYGVTSPYLSMTTYLAFPMMCLSTPFNILFTSSALKWCYFPLCVLSPSRVSKYHLQPSSIIGFHIMSPHWPQMTAAWLIAYLPLVSLSIEAKLPFFFAHCVYCQKVVLYDIRLQSVICHKCHNSQHYASLPHIVSLGDEGVALTLGRYRFETRSLCSVSYD